MAASPLWRGFPPWRLLLTFVRLNPLQAWGMEKFSLVGCFSFAATFALDFSIEFWRLLQSPREEDFTPRRRTLSPPLSTRAWPFSFPSLTLFLHFPLCDTKATFLNPPPSASPWDVDKAGLRREEEKRSSKASESTVRRNSHRSEDERKCFWRKNLKL